VGIAIFDDTLLGESSGSDYTEIILSSCKLKKWEILCRVVEVPGDPGGATSNSTNYCELLEGKPQEEETKKAALNF
jgi:hypothetical protein